MREILRSALKEVRPLTLPPMEEMQNVHLRGFSYADLETVMPALKRALENCGCWVMEEKAPSAMQLDVHFELHLRDAYELYSELISAGVEMTRENHLRMTGLCTLRNHNPRKAIRRRVVNILLQISFLDAAGHDPAVHGVGLA
jgi:hypothetical protein